MSFWHRCTKPGWHQTAEKWINRRHPETSPRGAEPAVNAVVRHARCCGSIVALIPVFFVAGAKVKKRPEGGHLPAGYKQAVTVQRAVDGARAFQILVYLIFCGPSPHLLFYGAHHHSCSRSGYAWWHHRMSALYNQITQCASRHGRSGQSPASRLCAAANDATTMSLDLASRESHISSGSVFTICAT